MCFIFEVQSVENLSLILLKLETVSGSAADCAVVSQTGKFQRD